MGKNMMVFGGIIYFDDEVTEDLIHHQFDTSGIISSYSFEFDMWTEKLLSYSPPERAFHMCSVRIEWLI
jgi:hypothetical protein